MVLKAAEMRPEVAHGGLATASRVVVRSGAEAVRCGGSKGKGSTRPVHAFYRRERRWMTVSTAVGTAVGNGSGAMV